jgi:aerobic carbon-monoxide dehydrogenase medium subunit
VKAAELSYECPSSLEEALAIKRHWGLSGQFLAGGQSLIPAVNMRLNSSQCLIDLNRIASLRGIREEDGCVVIGAMTRHAEVAASPIVRQRLPVLVEASRFLAHSAIRNRGTFGGSIALFDPAAEWPAACLLLDAQIHTVSPAGRRSIAADRFIQGLYKTDLDENGMIESVTIPFQEPVERSVVLEQSRRLGDFASAAVMARGVLTDTSAPTLRLVFFAVSDRPLRIESLEQELIPLARAGRLPEIGFRVKEALTSLALVADLYHSVPTKRHLAAVLAQRAVAAVVAPQL